MTLIAIIAVALAVAALVAITVIDGIQDERRIAQQRAIKECQNKGHRLFNVRRASNDIQATTEDVTWWLDRIEGDTPIR